MTVASPWRPTPAHARAVLGALALAAGSVLLRRPDLAVIATPLVAVAVAGRLRRPTTAPEVAEVVGQTTLREGQVTTRRVQIADPGGGSEDVAVAIDPATWIEQDGTADSSAA